VHICGKIGSRDRELLVSSFSNFAKKNLDCEWILKTLGGALSLKNFHGLNYLF
jgi:hypothetical protein